jgi:hypothetical protein
MESNSKIYYNIYKIPQLQLVLRQLYPVLTLTLIIYEP